jgi:hypothetical protein
MTIDGSGYLVSWVEGDYREAAVGFSLLNDEYFWVRRDGASLQRAKHIIERYGLKGAMPHLKDWGRELDKALRWAGLLS